ncbi:MAG: glycosyltransferase family 9 protein [Akkermansiaceae bacterium]|jgi:ADP-heptose:LPS heptosyltransferase|nr:glycosyltransferase family 9 protein [Akkermansiaceae bacterium]
MAPPAEHWSGIPEPAARDSAAERVLVIKLGALGDIFLAMQAFAAVRRHHGGARITLLTRKQFAGLARQMPWFDEVWEDPAPKAWQVGRWLAWRRRLRGGGFARVYDLQCNDRSGTYFRLLAPRRPEWCGVVPGCSHRWAGSRKDPLPVPERLRRLLAVAGVQAAGPPELTWLDGDLGGLDLPEKFALLVPGCAPQHPYKRWPARQFAELAMKLTAHGVTPVAIGTAVDRDAVAELVALAPGVVDLTGKTSLGQVAALARRAVWVVTNDTGPAHIAGIVGAPTLVVMSRVTDPVRMLPHGPAVGWLKRDDLADLGADEVWTALQSISRPDAG